MERLEDERHSMVIANHEKMAKPYSSILMYPNSSLNLDKIKRKAAYFIPMRSLVNEKQKQVMQLT